MLKGTDTILAFKNRCNAGIRDLLSFTRSYKRHPKGSPKGGQFAPGGGSGKGGGKGRVGPGGAGYGPGSEYGDLHSITKAESSIITGGHGDLWSTHTDDGSPSRWPKEGYKDRASKIRAIGERVGGKDGATLVKLADFNAQPRSAIPHQYKKREAFRKFDKKRLALSKDMDAVRKRMGYAIGGYRGYPAWKPGTSVLDWHLGKAGK